MSDYLWDKEGSDPEIEGLELELGEFAYAPRPDGDYLWDRSGEPGDVKALELALGELAYDGDPPVLPLQPQPVKRTPSFGAPWKHARFMPLALAAGLLLIALGVTWREFTRERVEDHGWNLVPVLIANVDLPEGTLVTPQLVSERTVPARFVSTSVVTPESARIVLGQKVQVAVAAGDPLMWRQFEPEREVEHLAARIVRGARALAVEVNDKAAWLQPNDHVDIIASLLDPKTNETVAVTVVENVPVVAAKKDENVAVMLLPEEAQLLAFAREFGDVTFTLRHGDDEPRDFTGGRERAREKKRTQAIENIRGR